jgi:SSS family solute:Na+ symporter
VTLGGLDAGILVAYLLAIFGMSYAFARRQRSGQDYFLAGRRMRGPVLAASLLANQASAISLVGAPAFVALRPGGGLTWLQYELALPLAMLLAIVVLLPALRSAPGASIYGYAERRFGPGTRRALAGAFLLSRGLALGVILYASALVLAAALGWSTDAALLAVGLVAVVYTAMGGVVADIWSDVLQLALLWLGTLVSAAVILVRTGPDLLAAIPPARARTLVTDSLGVGDGNGFAFWPMLLGGLFLYLSYYACDQSQAQRLLTARDDAAARRALVLNGLLRFPLVLTYCVFGLLLAGLLAVEPDLAAALRDRPPDALVPTFITTYLPAGFRGLLVAGILAAAMSSIDSALNSLAAVTLEDVFGVDPLRQSAWLGRFTSLGWGAFAVGAGMVAARSGTGILELVNQVGSAFYGPVLAVFVVGALTRSVGGRAAVTGLAAGLAANLVLAAFAPGLSWLWWNPCGFLVSVTVALGANGAAPGLRAPAWQGRPALILGAAFLAMLALLAVLPRAVRTIVAVAAGT